MALEIQLKVHEDEQVILVKKSIVLDTLRDFTPEQ